MNNVTGSARQHVKNATLASIDGDLDRALSELIIASEQFVDGIQLAKTKEERRNLITQFDECAQEAERIKARQKFSVSKSISEVTTNDVPSDGTDELLPHQASAIIESEEIRQVTKKEQVVLLSSSKIDGLVFPIWNQANIDSHLATTGPYCDPNAIFTSKQPFVKGHVRLSTLKGQLVMSDNGSQIHNTLTQQVLNDCSLVASLIVASQWSFRFKNPLLTCHLYPQDEALQPILNPDGKYMMKVHLNGTTRQVVVDDSVPVDENGDFRSILVFSSKYPDVAWPAIIEKIFLKISGPDFRGSNSASDLSLLTGWLPEEITFRGSVHDVTTLWTKIHNSWLKGDVLLTLGSGKLTPEEQTEYGIVSEHNYAITCLRDDGDEKVLTLQNPWSGESSLNNTQTTFDMDLTQVCYRFATLFLNWNPRKWPYKATVHAQIDESQFSITTQNVSQCPQYQLVNTSPSKDLSIFLTLSRHKTSSTTRKVYSSLAIYDNAGERVLVPTSCIAKTEYRASYESSLDFTLPPQKNYTIVLSQESPLPRESITLTAYSTSSCLSLSAIPVSSLHRRVLLGEWTRTCSGGPSPLASFIHNPWYRLTTTARETNLTIILESRTLHAIGFALTHSHSKPPTLTSKNMVRTASAVKYAPSFVTQTTLLREEGSKYALTCTTRQPSQLGDFQVTFISDAPLSVEVGVDINVGVLNYSRKWYWTRQVLERSFTIKSERMNFVTVYLHASRSAVVHLEICPSSSLAASNLQRTLSRVDGQGSVVLERFVIQGNQSYMLSCQISDCRNDEEFEVQVYSDSTLQLERC